MAQCGLMPTVAGLGSNRATARSSRASMSRIMLIPSCVRTSVAMAVASLLWAVVFLARLVVQGWLYDLQEETWLGVARLAMGVPLFGLALLGTILAVRKAQRAPAET